ncbi:carbohydrate kinase [Macrococcus hajekii]|uniref:Carbohydrate kinase n=1 Tax=Macrococcus hajekii TaxID=198482 RepID=A0A4R6BIR5_9STAP|nr:carbohydrate kinase [Macrococcus hajekii]TDM01381.1 carbohydrate kinase [Macrococcus hajekii]GGB11115.1 fructokinase [Macrococcus hajekii]
MAKLYAIGEALIDFIPHTKGVALKEVTDFETQVGGAPANVASCVAKLGKESVMLTQLGQDAFGELIVDTLEETGVDTSHITRTDEANTALAFVSLTAEGERDFAFYRKPSADMLMTAEAVQDIPFTRNDILHFCSVALVPSAMKEAHIAAIERMTTAGGTIIFDPNLRLPLWPSHAALNETVKEFMPKAHILKISDEELSFITGSSDPAVISTLFTGLTEVVIYTEGAKGASIYTKQGKIASHAGYQVQVEDTTGAGDAFIGSVIYQLLDKRTVETLIQEADDILAFSNAVGALTTTKKGAIHSLPDFNDIKKIKGE